MMSFQNSLPTSHIPESLGELPSPLPNSTVYFRSRAADQLPIAKYEPVDDLVVHSELAKDGDGSAVALLVTEASPEPQTWGTSEDLMDAVFGGDSTFNISLKNDIYFNTNKETAVNIFPAIPYFLALANMILQKSNPLLVTTSFPHETPEMYFWRGDYGLLDRLSYGESGEIPRNWKMTSLDSAKVQARIDSGPPAHFSQSTEVPLLSDKPFGRREKDREVLDSDQPGSLAVTSPRSFADDATALSRGLPKVKRHELLVEVSNCIEDGSTKRRWSTAIINMAGREICVVFRAASVK